MASRLGPADDEVGVIADINVTPFIDVALVLLIIFMVAAPLSTVDSAVDLPASTAAPQPRPKHPIVLSVGRDLSLRLGGEPVDRDDLGAALDRAAASDRDARVTLAADRAVRYGDLMAVMNLLRGAGYAHIALAGLHAPDGAPPP